MSVIDSVTEALDAAWEAAESQFSDKPVAAPVVGCPYAQIEDPNKPAATPPKGGGWTPEQLKEKLAKCDGGTGVWEAAKKANGDKEPGINLDDKVRTGSVNTQKGVINLNPNMNPCQAVQTLVQESANLSHKPDFDKVTSEGYAGDVSREQFIRRIEHTEYDGVQKVLTAYDKCASTWGCPKGQLSEKEWARSSKTFEDYYKRLAPSHKEHYGKFWDANMKDKYNAKHPPP